MDIRYVYPNALLLKRIKNLRYIDEAFPLGGFESITTLVARLVERFGEQVFLDLPKLLRANGVEIPELGTDLDAWLKWIDRNYISCEPSTLSPGAMSNAPDRFDGFHSFNVCCRGKADTGRSKKNLASYMTDRRVFEYWSDGDWIAADRLYGKIKAEFPNEPCLNAKSGKGIHPTPCAVDHIGPLSSGFSHRPEFQFLCSPCNSAKNNRMMLRDVVHLRAVEAAGKQVISWHSKALWDARKSDVVDKETAERLSKLLRDNRHTLMSIFNRIAEAGYFTFLASYLGLHHADNDVEFVNVRVENHITRFDNLEVSRRTSRQAIKQKARRFRVAFDSLRDYFQKHNRNAFVVSNNDIDRKVESALKALEQSTESIKQLDERIAEIWSSGAGEYGEAELREIIERLPTTEPNNFALAKKELADAMALVAARLSGMWADDRYVRTTLDSEY